MVLAGPGNNGADARAIARRLREAGRQVDLWEFPKTFNRSGWQDAWQDFLVQWPKNAPVVDGLFGSGLSRPLQGDYARVVEDINALAARVYAVDILLRSAGDGVLKEDPLFGRRLRCLSLPCRVFFLPEYYPYVGMWQVLDIGMDTVPYPGVRLPFETIEKEKVHEVPGASPSFFQQIRPRTRFAFGRKPR